MPEHLGAILCGRVAGADAGEDGRAEITTVEGELLYLGERAVEVFLDVV